MTELPFQPASLDGIITTHTIYFVSDLERAFAELADALKNSGEAVIGLGDPEAMKGLLCTSFQATADCRFGVARVVVLTTRTIKVRSVRSAGKLPLQLADTLALTVSRGWLCP